MRARLAAPLATMQSPRALLPSRSQGSRSSGVSDSHAQACGQQPWVGQCTSMQRAPSDFGTDTQQTTYQSPFMSQCMIAVPSALHSDEAFQVERSSGGLNFDKQYSLIGLPGSPSGILLTEVMPPRTSQDSAYSDSVGSKHYSPRYSSQLSVDAAPSSSIMLLCRRSTGCSCGHCSLGHTFSLTTASTPASPSRSAQLLSEHCDHHTARQTRGHGSSSSVEMGLLQACAIAASAAHASPRLQSVLARGLKYVTGSVSSGGGTNHKAHLSDNPRSPSSQLPRSQSVCFIDKPSVRGRMLSRCATEGAGKMSTRSVGDLSSSSAGCNVPVSYSTGATRFRPLLPSEPLPRHALSEVLSSSLPGEGVPSKPLKQGSFLPPVTW